MRNVFDERIIKITFLCSLLIHCLFLGMPGFNLDTRQVQKPKDITVEIKIEIPSLLPKIDVMGEEKKLKETVKKEDLPKPESKLELEPEPESKPQPEEEKIAEELELEEQVEEVIVEKPKPEPPKEIVKVINPQEEAMLRYQDMIKQKIESCRRYPNWAKKQGLEGISYLVFTLLSNGIIQDIKIIHSSGFDILDKEAISTVKRASPFKPIPLKFNCSSFIMEVALVFQLK